MSDIVHYREDRTSHQIVLCNSAIQHLTRADRTAHLVGILWVVVAIIACLALGVRGLDGVFFVLAPSGFLWLARGWIRSNHKSRLTDLHRQLADGNPMCACDLAFLESNQPRSAKPLLTSGGSHD